MAETLISPGVLARENDNSFIRQQPVAVGAAIIGPTVKGPVEIPTVVTTYSDYLNRFGGSFLSGSQEYSFLTQIAVYNYFQNNGQSLLVARVASGSYTSANSTPITNGELATTASLTVSSASLAPLTLEVSGSFSVNGITLKTTGSVQANTATQINVLTGSNFANTLISASEAFNFSSSVAPYSSSLQYISSSVTATTISFFTTASQIGTVFSADVLNAYTFVSGSTTTNFSGATNEEALVLKTISEGTIMNSNSTLGTNGILPSGSSDNIRWQIANSNTNLGTFSLIIRQGNDTTTEPIVLETWTGLSLDPTQPNYISKVIGDSYQSYNSSENYIEVTGNFPTNSRYVFVSSVAAATPNYFDNNGSPQLQYTASIPTNASGAFEGATGDLFYGGGAKFYENITGTTNLQGIDATDYDDMISLFANQDDYKFNVITTPGLNLEDNTTQLTTLNGIVQSRGDAIAVIDSTAFGSTVSNTITQASSINSSYAATYWPWLQTIDPGNGQLVWVPSSVMVPAVYAFNDSVSEPWFAPAGINRGGLDTVVRAERKLTQSQRNDLYIGNVNPIATFPGTGVVVYGQKTLQKKSSALDRVNVRRLLIQLKSYISQVANNLVFEQNSIATRNQFLSQVNPYLESVQQRQGLYAFRVIMDDSNNTPDVIDRNQMIGQIYLQPTKTAEFIYLDFNILPTGATFPA